MDSLIAINQSNRSDQKRAPRAPLPEWYIHQCTHTKSFQDHVTTVQQEKWSHAGINLGTKVV